MFALLRKLIVSGVATIGGVVLWHGAPVQTQLLLLQSEADAAEHSGVDEEGGTPESRLMPGTTGQRFVAWALFVVLIPIVTAPVAGPILRKGSNLANVLLLFGYTGLDVLAAYVVDFIHVGGLLSGIAYLVGLLAVFGYNLRICAFLARLQDA